MLYSLLIKLTMLVVTMGVVFWIGWTMPQPRHLEMDRGLETTDGSVNRVPPVEAPAAAVSAPVPLFDRPRASSPAPRRTVVGHLDLNRATEQEFEALPGIGPVLAQRIVQFRQSRGGFTEVDQLRKVKGIGRKTFDRIRTLVSVTTRPVSAPAGRKAT